MVNRLQKNNSSSMPGSQDRTPALSQEAARWVLHMQSEAATEEDRREFADWRGQSSLHEQTVRRIESVWQQLGTMPREVAQALVEEEQPRWSWRTAVAGRAPAYLLATFVLVIVVGLWSFQRAVGVETLGADYRTGIGEQRQVSLPDGSLLHLNTASAVRVQFSQKERRIDLLRGEAAFTVAADPNRTFTVDSGDVSMRALGTQFIVRQDGPDVTLTVLEHAVSLRPPKGTSGAVSVSAGHRIVYSSRDGLGPTQTVDLDNASSWRQGKLIFDSQPLGVVVEEINRYRLGQVVIFDKALRDRKVTAVLSLTDPDAMLRAIERTLPVQVTRLTPYLILLH